VKWINAPYIILLSFISCTMPGAALPQSLIWETNLGGMYSENGNALDAPIPSERDNMTSI
jgi:hypothetical protein